MSFKCQKCNTLQKPGVSQKRQVVKSRETSYTNRRTIEDDEGKKKVIVKNSTGWEIVKEVALCGDCYVA